MNEYIADKVHKIAAKILNDALNNGNAEQTVYDLRDGIIKGWMLALDDVCTPEDIKRRALLIKP